MPSVILDMLVDEYERLKEVIPLYQEKYALLPKGSLAIKKIGREEYAYRYFKEKGRSKAQYIGSVLSPAYFDMKEKLNDSHYHRQAIRDMKHQVEDLEMAIRIIRGREERRWRKSRSSMKSGN